MLSSFKRILIASSLVGPLLIQASAGAGLISITADQGGSAAAGAIYSTFDNSTLGTMSQSTRPGLAVQLDGGAAFVRGGIASQYARPNFSGANNQYFYLDNSTSPGAGPDSTNYIASMTGSVTFTNAAGGTMGTYFGILWGSVDSYNALTINFADGSSSVTINGSGMAGVSYNTSTSYYVNINASTAISSVVASSTSNSFELDNVAFGSSSVPEPASMTMLGLGLVGVGLVARQRRRV